MTEEHRDGNKREEQGAKGGDKVIKTWIDRWMNRSEDQWRDR